MQYTKFVFAYLVVFFCAFNSIAQKSENNNRPLYDYQQGLDLYQQKSYKSAQYFFKKALKNSTINSEEDCSYYYAMTAVKLNQKNGEKLMLDFIKKHPTSNRKNNAFLEVGNHFYENGKPAASLKWFQKASTKYLTRKQEETFNFRMGYALFSNKKYTKAKEYFLPLTRSGNHIDEACYYYGYMAYLKEDYSTAKEYFEKISSDRYTKEIAYYETNINFKEKNYKGVIAKSLELLKKASRKEVSNLSKIIGESYFYLGEYKKAIPYLKKYRGKRNRLKTTDHYFLGYAYYKEKEYNNAIVTFNKITKGKDKVAQNAYYHLGDCYLKSDKKSEALNAFKSCSELDFDQDIKEDAWYNYAKLSYEIGNPYKSTPEVLQSYVNAYPNRSRSKEITKLIISSYINAKDYAGALKHYSKNHISKDKTYQKAALFNGMLLFQNSNYHEALKYFTIANNQVFDKTLQVQAIYWKAETDYRLYNFKQALADFKRFKGQRTAKTTEEYKSIYYSIGYTYFKLKNYEKAKSNFAIYLKNKNISKLKKDDSYVRLGDCHFIGKSYWNAMEAYNKVIKSRGIDDDYAQYQKAISYGFVKRNERKIETLLNFSKQHPKSSYKDDALYELGNAYINGKQNAKAINSFDVLKEKFPRSVYVSKALLKQGLIYFNDNNAEKSIETYKYIVKKYPKTKAAQQAVTNARQVYIDIDKVDEYAVWVKSLNFTNITDTDLDNTMYEAAENKYLANQLKQSISSFKKYLVNFPEGIHALKAHFYSAQGYYSQKDSERATPHYQYVIDQSSNEFTEQALSRLGQIYLENENWDLAILILKRLELEANFPQNILFAQSNLMKGLYTQEDFKNTVVYAEKVLENKKVNNQIKSDAYVYIARSAIKTDALDKAEKAYTEVNKISKGSLKAEALYYDAYFKNRNGNFEASNKSVQTLAAEYASYKRWGIKGLIVMAKNNIGLKDNFQATYILKSIIENYSDYTDLVQEAQSLLESIEEDETTTEDENF